MILDYQPCVLVDTENITEDEWLEYRRKGIGGSDAAVTMNVSPFKSQLELFHEKVNNKKCPIENWVALQVGKLLEDLVADIFSKQTGLQVIKLPRMFYHPLYPHMLANIDYLVIMPDGSYAILECKTGARESKAYWDNGAIPLNYKLQGVHYMSVLNINKVFFAFLYGNKEDKFIIRELDRNLGLEQELIFNENLFWKNYIEKNQEPPLIGDPKSIKKFMLELYTPNIKAESIQLDNNLESNIAEYYKLKKEESSINKNLKEIKSKIEAVSLPIIKAMGESCSSYIENEDMIYEMFYEPTNRVSINSKKLESLYPEIYAEVSSVSKNRSFKISSSVKEFNVA